MSEPPRLKQIYLKNSSITYFVTFCTDARQPMLANPAFFAASQSVLKGLSNWHVWCGVIMPDHVHLLVSPLVSDHSISAFSAAYKRRSRKMAAFEGAWQKGCFDRLLRTEESANNKWAYIRANPVRAGFATNWEDWPYRMDWKNLL